MAVGVRASGPKGAGRLRAAALALAVAQCGSPTRALRRPPAAGREGAAARVHTRDGRLYVAERWSADETALTLHGREFDAERRPVRAGDFRVPRDEVAIVEVNGAPESLPLVAPVAAMGVVTAGSVAGTAACAANPKACFGSCPTFYVATARGPVIQAEGFSSAIARSMESDDLDDLPLAAPAGGMLSLTMRNEALETHVTRRVALVAVDAPPGSGAYRAFDEETFHAVRDARAPEACDANELCALLAERDSREWNPGSDGADLAARTAAVLRFPPPRAPEAAVVLTARNSLMSTYALYHMIALLGRTYGDFLARVERSPLLRWRLGGFSRALGGVDVAARQRGEPWRRVATLPYVGPNAPATRAAVFDVRWPDEPVEVRVEFARAHWRVDALRLGAVTATDLAPVEVPAEVTSAGRLDPGEAAASLRGEGERLVTLPGDDVELRFAVPAPRGSPAYFLRTRGYYYEWMRAAWLRDEDPRRAAGYLADPAGALRELAAPYRAQEGTMDAIFEASRFARPASP